MLARTASRALQTARSLRGFSSTSRRTAAHGHEDHHHLATGATTTECMLLSSDVSADKTAFLNPTWRNTLVLVVASILVYPYLPSPSSTPASPSLSPDNLQEAASADDKPYLTRLLAKYTPKAALWTERNDKHLQLTKESAETRLLFQEAERPRVWRMRYPRLVRVDGGTESRRTSLQPHPLGITNASAFEQASPHAIPVGSQVDLSSLEVKTE